MSDRTLRGYWAEDKSAGVIPNKNIDKFCDLLIEILPGETSRETAKCLLQGDKSSFYNALLSNAGQAWDTLVSEPDILLATIKPMALGFAESDDDYDEEPAYEAILGQGFFFRGTTSWGGEAVAFGEHLGEWQMISFAGGKRIFPLTGGEFTFPPKNSKGQPLLREKTKPGYYRYFIIAHRGNMMGALRERLHGANPLTQTTLNLLGDMLQSPNVGCSVLSTSIKIISP